MWNLNLNLFGLNFEPQSLCSQPLTPLTLPTPSQAKVLASLIHPISETFTHRLKGDFLNNISLLSANHTPVQAWVLEMAKGIRQ